MSLAHWTLLEYSPFVLGLLVAFAAGFAAGRAGRNRRRAAQ